MEHSQNPTLRHWKLLQALSEAPDGLTIRELADRFDVSPRTINRDLALLQSVGLPIRENLGPHGLKFWSFDESTAVIFTYDEAAALYLGRRFLKPLMQTFLWDAADSALKKIRGRLGSRSLRYLEQLLDVFHHTTFGWSDYEQKGDLIESLLRGCEEQREVMISYHSLTADRDETYAIRPYDLIFHAGSIYIVGYSCKSADLRHWKLDRMSSALATDQKFDMPDDFDAEAYRSRCFGVYAPKDDEVRNIRVLFDPRVARYVTEHRWHETQKFEPRPDGSVIGVFELSETEEFKRWLLSFGMHAEVLEPEELRKDMLAEIEGMTNRYGNSY